MNDHLVAPAAPRSPWQRLYGAAHRWRQDWYRSRREQLPRPVVSIGNLHWGGTGKTPITAALATHLTARGLRVGILSRGYGRRSRGPLVVSAGDGPRVGPEIAGDEPFWLAQLPGVSVAVAEQRSHAGRLLLGEVDLELFLLDDGFSHLALARDLDLLVLPQHDLFGGGRLPPSGRLREPLASVARADAVIVAASSASPPHGSIAALLRPFGFTGQVFACGGRTEAACDAGGEPLPADQTVVLVSGVANPQRVAETAAGQPLTIAEHLIFPDHHRYPRRSLERIRRAVLRHGAKLVLTTSKDRSKLVGRLGLPVVELPWRAEPQRQLLAWLDERVDHLVGAPG